MRVDVDFKLDKDINNKCYDAILIALGDNYSWYKEFGSGPIIGYLPDVFDNDICISKTLNMFLGVVKNIANELQQHIFVKDLNITANGGIAKPYKPGKKIEYMSFKQYKDIIIDPKEI